MRIENQGVSPKVIPIKKEQLKEIPMSWFVGGGAQGKIQGVNFSPEFYKLGGDLAAFMFYYEGKIDEHSSDSFEMRIPSKPKNNVSTTIQELEREIKTITGFSPKDLITKREDLRNEYIGEKMAPFAFKLF